jgi:hypothetical protein
MEQSKGHLDFLNEFIGVQVLMSFIIDYERSSFLGQAKFVFENINPGIQFVLVERVFFTFVHLVVPGT